jgi:hypothetical protein
MRAVFQSFQMPGIVASLPAIECLRADIKVPAGETGMVIMALVVVKPF